MVTYSDSKLNKRVRSVALLVGFASAVGSMPPAKAQSQGEQLTEVVVSAPNYVPETDLSATKIAIPLIETPQAVSVITRDQIDVLDFQNLQQAMRYTAGVIGENFGPDERYDWLTLRGFNPVEYVDGLQAPIGSVSNVGLDLWAAGSVEVLKGPSGVLYGQTPPGGLVNITSRRPQQDFHAEGQVQFGTFSNKQVAGDITGDLSGGGMFLGRLTALWRDRDTQTDGVKSTRKLIAPAFTWNLAAGTHLTLLGYYQKDEVDGDGGGFLPSQGTILPNPNGQINVGFNAGDPYNVFTRKQWGAGYEFGHVFNETFTFKQNLKYSVADSYSQSVYGAGLQSDLHTLNRYNFVFPENVKQFAVDSQLEIRGASGAVTHTALVGFDYRDLKNNTMLGFAFGPTLNIFHPVYGLPIAVPSLSPYLDQDQKQSGVYGQDEMKLDHWRLTLSAREDWLDTRNFTAKVTDNAFTWRAGLNYVLDSGVAPYAAYSTSFLPTAGADFNGTPFVPSTGKQVEAGLKFEPRFLPRDVKMFTSAAVYDLKQEHVLTSDPNHAFFSLQTGEVEVKGVELEGVARLHERVSLNASYSYTHSEVTQSNGPDLGKELPIVPKNKLSLFADYTQQTGPLAGLGAGVGVRYMGASFGDPANTLESGAETLLDALIHYNWRHWELAVNASNLTDKIYVQRCSSLAQCFYASRRSVFVSAGQKW